MAQRIIGNPTVFDLKIRGFGLDLRQNEWEFAPEYGLRERNLRFDNTSKMKVAINGNRKHHGITCETTRDVSGTTGCNQAQKVIVT